MEKRIFTCPLDDRPCDEFLTEEGYACRHSAPGEIPPCSGVGIEE